MSVVLFKQTNHGAFFLTRQMPVLSYKADQCNFFLISRKTVDFSGWFSIFFSSSKSDDLITSNINK